MIILKIILIFILMYIGLSLYFQHRMDKKHEAFKKRLNNESKRQSKNSTK
jgi:predicted tellurium resistance membrane protein TerC